jgi:hypothetical protein
MHTKFSNTYTTYVAILSMYILQYICRYLQLAVQLAFSTSRIPSASFTCMLHAYTGIPTKFSMYLLDLQLYR